MKTIYKLISTLSIFIIFSCSKDKPKDINEMLAYNVPKFINALPEMSKNSMESDFEKMRNLLDFTEHPISNKFLFAESNDQDKKLGIIAVPLIQASNKSEYSISLTTFPQVSNDTLLSYVKPLVRYYPRKDKDNLPTWEVNGWLLQIGSNSIMFSAPSDKSIYMLIEELNKAVDPFEQ